MGPGRTGTSGQGRVPKPVSWHIACVMGLALVTSLAACGGASPVPSLSPTQEPSPSATPIDLVSVFVGRLANGLTASSTVSGTLDVGSIHGTLEGSYTFGTAGAYSYQITTIVGESRSISRGVTVNGTSWSRAENGPWLQDAAAASGSTGTNAFAQMTEHLPSLRDTGVVTLAGHQVHSLQAPGGLSVPASALGISDPDVHDPKASVSFYAQDDGTPAGMAFSMTWTQGSGDGAQDARMDMILAFTTFGTPITVQPPDDVWQVYSSKEQHFSVAYPGDWQADGNAVSVSFAAPDNSAGIWIGLGAESAALDQKTWAAAVLSGATQEFGVRSDASLPLVVAGVSTTAYEFHGKSNGQSVFFMDVPLTRDGEGYELQWIGIPGYEPADIGRFKTMLATFAFTS